MEVFTITEISIGKLAQKVDLSKSTLNRYVDIGLIEPIHIEPKNNYRHFDNETIQKLKMVEILKKKPFRLKLKEIKGVLNQVDLVTLENHLQNSKKNLLDFLIEKEIF